MSIGVSEATLLAVLLEAVLFGAFTTLYAITVYLNVSKIGKRLNQVILAVSSGMYALALTHLAIDIQRILNAFVKVGGDTVSSDTYLSVPSDPLYVAQISVYTVQTILGDAFMIYRLYVVWAKNKFVTAPAVLCFVGCIAVGIGGPHSVSQASHSDLIYVPSVKHWGTAFYSTTLVTNFLCTVLIAARIWWIERRSSRLYKSRSLSPIIIIIVESGAVYSATLLAVIVTYTINDWSHYFFLDAICPVIGLVFTVIIVRIGLGVTTGDTSTSGSRSIGHRLASQTNYPIAVQMTQLTTTRNDVGEPVDLSRGGSLNDDASHADIKNVSGSEMKDEP